MEQAQSVGPAANASNQRIRQFAFGFQDLFTGFNADDRLEITHHGRIRMGASSSANDIEMRLCIGHPITQGFIHGIFQCTSARRHRVNFRPQQTHPVYIRLLTFNIFSAHKDFTFHIKQRASRGRCHPVLTRACFSNDLFLAHALGQ